MGRRIQMRLSGGHDDTVSSPHMCVKSAESVNWVRAPLCILVASRAAWRRADSLVSFM